MKYTIKDIAIIGMGIALFVASSMCLRVPIFENYYLCLGYIIMTVYCYSFGVTSGTIVGTAGTFLYCFLINGLRGMPGWALGNITIGLTIGFTFKLAKKINNRMVENIIHIVSVILGTAAGILLVKSAVEHILYLQPFALRVASNMYAFIADAFIICVSLPVCRRIDPYIKKYIKKY